MNAPTGSQSNIVLKPQDMEQVDSLVPEGRKGKEKGSDDKFKFNKRGKLKNREIEELKRTHKSLKNWTSNKKQLIPGGGSVVEKVSQYEDLSNHGGAHAPLLGPATITEKGVGLGQVIGLQATGDQTAHTPVPGAEVEPTMLGIDCAQCTVTVHYREGETDMQNVNSLPTNISAENTHSMTGVEDEEFTTDLNDLLKTWDIMEDDENEWRVEGGVRRGGRKVSRRMSELIDMFGGSNDKENSNLLVDEVPRLISHTKGRGADNKSVVKDIVQSIDLVSDVAGTERCDWSTNNTIQHLTTNQRQARRDMIIGDMDNGSAVRTDQSRRESWR